MSLPVLHKMLDLSSAIIMLLVCQARPRSSFVVIHNNVFQLRTWTIFDHLLTLVYSTLKQIFVWTLKRNSGIKAGVLRRRGPICGKYFCWEVKGFPHKYAMQSLYTYYWLSKTIWLWLTSFWISISILSYKISIKCFVFSYILKHICDMIKGNESLVEKCQFLFSCTTFS